MGHYGCSEQDLLGLGLARIGSWYVSWYVVDSHATPMASWICWMQWIGAGHVAFDAPRVCFDNPCKSATMQFHDKVELNSHLVRTSQF